jgi:PhnB protein
MTAKAIPDGYHTATPYLIIHGADEALEFYKHAFGAIETMHIATPDGKVGHAEIRIGDSVIMLADEYPDMGYLSPKALGGSPVSLMLYVEDVDHLFKKAIEAGGKALKPVEDQFYGDRSGTLTDPYGHVWTLATHTEDLAPAELAKRAEAFFRERPG